MTLRAKTGAGLLWGLWAPAAVAGGMALAPLHALAALLLAPWGAILTGLRRNALWLAPFGLLVVWAAISQTWSLYPATPQTVKFGAGLLAALGLCAGLGAASAAQARFFLWLAVGSATALAIMEIIEATSGMAINRLFQPTAIQWMLERNPGKGAAVLLLTAPAVAIWLAFGAGATLMRRIAAGCLALACGFVCLHFGMDANRVVCAVALVAAGAAALAPRLAVRAIAAAAAATLLAAPTVYATLANQLADIRMAHSWEHRLVIWRHITDAIAQKPLFGWGMDATRRLESALGAGSNIPLHAHSSWLQIWVELGAVGAALVALGLVLGGWRLADAVGRNRVHAAAACAVMAAAWTSWTLSFSLWQEWYLGAVGIAAAVVAAMTNRQATQKADLNP